MNNTMTTQESSQKPFPLYYFFAEASQAMPLYYFFVGMMPDAIVLFFSCCRSIIFRGLPVKGKCSVHPNFAKILVLGRLGCVIVLFFRLGQPGNVIVLFFSGGPASRSHCIIYSRPGSARLGHCIIFNRSWENEMIRQETIKMIQRDAMEHGDRYGEMSMQTSGIEKSLFARVGERHTVPVILSSGQSSRSPQSTPL